jgi:hypothetical protein
MSQKSVEMLIGRLATDEPLRRRFTADPADVVRLFLAEGYPLSSVEARALVRLDNAALDRFARALDPRLQKAALDIDALPSRPRS